MKHCVQAIRNDKVHDKVCNEDARVYWRHFTHKRALFLGYIVPLKTSSHELVMWCDGRPTIHSCKLKVIRIEPSRIRIMIFFGPKRRRRRKMLHHRPLGVHPYVLTVHHMIIFDGKCHRYTDRNFIETSAVISARLFCVKISDYFKKSFSMTLQRFVLKLL